MGGIFTLSDAKERHRTRNTDLLVRGLITPLHAAGVNRLADQDDESRLGDLSWQQDAAVNEYACVPSRLIFRAVAPEHRHEHIII